MFSIGIFSTHIPYVAFVVFYIYLLLFGVEKASKEELQSADNTLKIEVNQYTAFTAQNNISNFSYHQYYLNENKFDLTEIFVNNRKTEFTEQRTCSWNFYFLSPLSNRPPPFLA